MAETLIDITPPELRGKLPISDFRILDSGAIALTLSEDGRSDIILHGWFCDWLVYDGSELLAAANKIYLRAEELGPPESSNFMAHMSRSERYLEQVLLGERLESIELELASNTLTLSMVGDLFILLVPNMDFPGNEMLSIFAPAASKRTMMDVLIAVPLMVRPSCNS